MGRWHAEVLSSDVTVFATQAKLVRFVSAGLSAYLTPPLLIRIQGTQGIGI